MLHGDKARFAIEFKLNENPGGKWMFGRFCYWIGGEQIGDFDEGISLRDVLFSMQYIVKDAGRRTAPSLILCDEKEIFRVIHESLSESGNDLTRLISADLMPACFDICPHVDIFNTWHIYLVDTQEYSKVVYSADGGKNVETVGLTQGEFDAVASAVYRELIALLDTYQ